MPPEYNLPELTNFGPSPLPVRDDIAIIREALKILSCNIHGAPMMCLPDGTFVWLCAEHTKAVRRMLRHSI